MSNIAINPSSIGQVAFYAKRLKQEESVRRVGLILIVFSMTIQIFAAMVPPEKSLAASGNDVINGGVSSIEQLKAKYNSKADVRALYTRFGLKPEDLTHKGADLVNFNFQNQGAAGTKTVGRVNFASTKDHNLGSFAGTTFWSRSASEWKGSEPAYYFGKQKGTDGKYFYVWVLKNCGNIAYRPTSGSQQVATITPERTPTPTGGYIISAPAPKPVAPTPAPTPKPVTPTPTPPTPTPPTPETPGTPKPSKTAVNVTQNLNAEQTVATSAKAGDIIKYSLTATSTSKVANKDYVIEDYIGDVLDYSTVDQTFLASEGGKFIAETKTIKFDKLTVPAGGSVTKSFAVILKPTIPSTNTPNATATDYDCKMQNGYGNEIIIPVECATVKQVESLPNTGPGSTIAASLGVTVVSYYFFMRSRLLRKEVGIIKKAYQAGY